MKRILLAAMFSVAAVNAARATADFYINSDVVTNAPVIDAINFVNQGIFSFATGDLYEFSSVRHYTNESVMENGIPSGGFLDPRSYFLGGSGFIFDTAPASSGSRTMAASFYNAPLAGNPVTNARIYADYKLEVSATNIVNRGLLSVAQDGLVSLRGVNLDLARGFIEAGVLNATTPGIYDREWGFGTNRVTPIANFTQATPFSPNYAVTTFPGYLTLTNAMYFYDPAAVTSAEFIYEIGTNRTVQIVFVNNPNPEIGVRIRSLGGTPADFGMPVVEWSAASTNEVGEIHTNRIYLSDTYGMNTTNTYITNYVKQVYKTFQPQNFSITFWDWFGFDFADPGVSPFTDKPASFWGVSATVSNAPYAAYGALLASTPDGTEAPSALRNSYGRVELTASRSLDLDLAGVASRNYLKLHATNHFSGSSNAVISAPYADISLGSTNGYLNLTSLLKSSSARFSGTIDAYSVVWTNQVVLNGETNPVVFNVLMVDSALSNNVGTKILDLSLRSTNLVIGDKLNLTGSLLLDTDWLTIATNASLDLSANTLLWRDSVPHVRGLTNFGLINFPNAIYFAGRNADGSDRPFASLLNTGTILGTSITALATNLTNQGLISSSSGPMTNRAIANLALLDGGSLVARISDVTLTAQNLTASNHSITAGRTLYLNVPGQLNAGTNDWQVFNGVNFPTRPVSGDLNLVTLRSKAIQNQWPTHLWPGLDRGPVTSGFVSNASLGLLVLDGALNSRFVFQGNGAASNALYVDRLELTNSAGQFDASGNLSQLSIASGMKIYYAQATINGSSIAEFLNGKNGGQLQWISSYNRGAFSSTNVVYPDGTTNQLNAALVASCNYDSDGDDIPNCVDPSPLPVPQARISASVVNSGGPKLALSWPSVGGATSGVYDTTNTSSSNWRWVTNVVAPAGAGSVTNRYLAPLGNGSRFYRVVVQPSP